MRWTHGLAAAAMTWLVAASSCLGGDNPLKISLVSEVTSIQPGHPFYVGLHLQHPSGYHTYWQFPGIVGVPTGAQWTLPKGFTAGPIEWPAPQQVKMFEIKAQGFNGEEILPVLITPPQHLEAGAKVRLVAKATWMCCGRDCNPGVEDLSLELPVKESTAERDTQWEPLFEAARASVPVPLAGWQVEATMESEKVLLKLTAESNVAKALCAKIEKAAFFTTDGFINPDKGQQFAKPQTGVITFALTHSEYDEHPNAKQFGGVVTWEIDGQTRAVRFTAPVHRQN
jgi:DsbC/DsbD-like thiol-disulfide interchange protein